MTIGHDTQLGLPSFFTQHAPDMTLTPRTWIAPLLLVALLCFASVSTAQAQERTPRFGLGFNAMLSTSEGLGLGFRGRVSAPINADLSVALDLGLTGFVLEGRDDAVYVFDPQVSGILTLPYGQNSAPYLIGGIGAYAAFDQEDDTTDGGPTIHGGVGWVRRLSDTTVYYEVNPALVVGEESVDVVFPLRIGVIF